MNWVTQSFLAMIGVSVMMLIIKRLTQFQLKPEVVNFFFFLFTTLAFLLFILLKRTPLGLPPRAIPLFLVVALVAVGYNYFSVSAISAAPNPGYVEAINSFRVVILLVASVFLFGSEINPMKILGIVLCTGGLILISL